MIAIKKILYPTDFSTHAHYAEPYAVELAKKFAAQVIISHVLPVSNYLSTYGVAIDTLSLERELEQAARTRLREIEVKLAEQSVAVVTDLSVGVPSSQIIEAASRHETDLIVIATHGHGPVKHIFLGSTAEKVVRKAPCPVLTIHHPEHEFVHP